MRAPTVRALWLALGEVLAFLWSPHPRSWKRRLYRSLYRP